MEKLGLWVRNPLFAGVIAALIAGAVGALIVLVIILNGGGNGLSAEVWRNLILALSAGVAFPIAIWRSFSASKQVKLTESGQNIDRYQKGAAMLGDSRMSVRQAGIFGLVELVKNDPQTYYVIVQELFCSFVRDRSTEEKRDHDEFKTELARIEGGTAETQIADDSQAAITHISYLRNSPKFHPTEMRGRAADQQFDINFDLNNANLTRANLGRANLMGAFVVNAVLEGAFLFDANLIGANLSGANLSRAILIDADLTDADLTDADLTDAKLTEAKGLTVKQLETAKNVDANYLKQLRLVEQAQEEEAE